MRRWILLGCCLPLLATTQAWAQGSTSVASADQIKKEVLQLEQEQDQAIADSDVKTLDRIWADKLIYTTPTGELLTKAQHLADFRSGVRKFETMQHDDIQAWVYGQNVVVLMGRSTSTLQYKGEISKGPRRFTNVFVKMDGRWQMVSHHVTDVAK